MTEPDRYFFVHMQKTAGTALFQRLQCAFPRDAIYPSPDDAGTIEGSLDVGLLQRRFAEHREELRVVTGHFPLCVSELLDAPFSTFTVLRDPVERTLSFLRDNKKRDPRARDQPIEEIYAHPIQFHGLIHNHMVKMLSLTTDELTAGVMTHIEFGAEHLERAKQNLAERIDVFGIQEHFEEFCAELTLRFGFDLGRPRFANRTEPSEVAEVFREQIAADNALDVELYRFAQGLREARLARDGS